MFLLCKLVGLRGIGKNTNLLDLTPLVASTSKKSFQTWAAFAEWLFQQSIIAANNFNHLLEWQY